MNKCSGISARKTVAAAALLVLLGLSATACTPTDGSPTPKSNEGKQSTPESAEYEDGYDDGYGYGSVYGLDLSQDDECSSTTDYSPYCEGWLDGWRAGARD